MGELVGESNVANPAGRLVSRETLNRGNKMSVIDDPESGNRQGGQVNTDKGSHSRDNMALEGLFLYINNQRLRR